jgi:hypothetical protein
MSIHKSNNLYTQTAGNQLLWKKKKKGKCDEIGRRGDRFNGACRRGPRTHRATASTGPERPTAGGGDHMEMRRRRHAKKSSKVALI